MTFDPNCYVEIPADKLADAVKLAYDFSRPQGLGFPHAKPGGLPDEDVQAIIDNEGADSRIAASMDYVHGRACKFTVFRNDGRLFVSPRWYDHGDWQLEELLVGVGVEGAADLMAAANGAIDAANEKWRRENA